MRRLVVPIAMMMVRLRLPRLRLRLLLRRLRLLRLLLLRLRLLRLRLLRLRLRLLWRFPRLVSIWVMGLWGLLRLVLVRRSRFVL